jgi:hypothetical protein
MKIARDVFVAKTDEEAKELAKNGASVPARR